MQGIDLGQAFDSGYKMGQGIDKAVGDMFHVDSLATGAGSNFLERGGDTPYTNTPGDMASGLDGNPTGGKLDSIGKIDDEVKIDDEFIKLVRDVAEMEWQQNFITLKPEIVTNIDSITTEREYANMLDDLNATIVEAIHNGADGL